MCQYAEETDKDRDAQSRLYLDQRKRDASMLRGLTSMARFSR